MPIGVFSHTHTQEEASAEWTIVHNLGTLAPAVDVFININGTQSKIIPAAVEVTDNRTVTVRFTSPRSGFAAVR